MCGFVADSFSHFTLLLLVLLLLVLSAPCYRLSLQLGVFSERQRRTGAGLHTQTSSGIGPNPAGQSFRCDSAPSCSNRVLKASCTNKLKGDFETPPYIFPVNTLFSLDLNYHLSFIHTHTHTRVLTACGTIFKKL